jgi:hypothetical protein
MKKETFADHEGYWVGRFFTYKGYRSWLILHQSGAKFPTVSFLRRRDAVSFLRHLDDPLWDFAEINPPNWKEIEAQLWGNWAGALKHTESKDRFDERLIWKEKTDSF